MIWIIGGTSDANEIAAQLANKSYAITLSTATSYGSSLARANNISIHQGRMNALQMLTDFSSYDLIIDASHPFATEVSINAMNACQQLGIEYIRYEREQLHFDNARYYASYDALIGELQKLDGKIFLTIGSNNIWRFAPLKARIIARILPAVDSLQKCLEAGIPPHQIIASKGIFKTQTNKALFVEYRAMHLVSKDSGEAGGMRAKLLAAEQAGMQVHILKRPDLNYPKVISKMSELVSTIKAKQAK